MDRPLRGSTGRDLRAGGKTSARRTRIFRARRVAQPCRPALWRDQALTPARWTCALTFAARGDRSLSHALRYFLQHDLGGPASDRLDPGVARHPLDRRFPHKAEATMELYA